MSALFQPLALRDLTLSNRVVVSPMCQYSSIDGNAQAWHDVHLGQLAMSSAGMLILEATAIEDIGRITPGCLGLYSDANEQHISKLLTTVRAVNTQSPLPLCIQLSHAGRKASSNVPWKTGAQIPLDQGGWNTVAPDNIAHKPGELPPQALSVAQIHAIKDKFVAATKRSDRLNIDAIELHCAHGYLMHQFLSPLSNQRDDTYGGTLENRMRLPLEIFSAVRDAWPEHKPLGIRLSATDWDEQSSWDINESVIFAQKLEALGCDWIDVSSGGVSINQKINLEPGYQVHLAKNIKQSVSIPVMAVGLITDPLHAEEIVAQGDADVVALARAFLYNPRWVWHAAATLDANVSVPEQYWRCAPANVGRLFGDTPIGQR
ncbi:MAG: NADH:flavin oxidoreductase/NADH oxidase [Granulosicoccus sp.]